ncbi:ABC transporter ATP-binding protein [Neobacillus ginsengisoli]|uniref:Energy-coupling factor transport system ATP-binding protein n=1 Tax=Neobacillus ginsengisoli TaxID=904295 RepID=A0ABT9XW48_9BACI|nr:energy-coupling factor transporter ATPase [Neobacillus ginsengisoli]MDQ0199721.1 energy-coupling factor transport system ATP-binding protein [Neobacillus ginsengisoli]
MAPIIQLKNVTYTYEDEIEPVLKNLSLEIFEGEFVLLVGPSGSGKSTICQTFNGIIPNVLEGEIEGEIIVDSKDVLKLELKDLATSMGLVFQDPDAQLCNIYVEDEIAFAPENLKVDPNEIRLRIKDSLEKVGMQGFEARKVFELSGGQKQKVGIASVLSMKPKILVLDNATANLDPQATKDIFDLLQLLHTEYGHTIVVVENKIDDLMHLADRVIVIEDGQVVSQGTPREILKHSFDHLINMGLWVPEISELAVKLQQIGFSFEKFPITVEEATEELQGKWNQAFLQSSRSFRYESELPDCITVKNLNYHYPNGTYALKDVSFSIKKGDFVAILGTNGSGKTTLVKHLMGIIRSPKNTIFLNGEDIHYKQLLDMTEHIGYVFQNPEHQFVTDNVFEETIYSLKVQHGIGKDDDIPQEIVQQGIKSLKSINLLEAKDKHPFVLSGGEKRRLSVVASLILGQDIVILDEPTTGQDYASATKLLELCHRLQQLGKTVIMITHDIRLMCKWANIAIVMHNGEKIYYGDTSDLFLQEDILKKASLIEPPISKLAKRLAGDNLEQGIITIEQFIQTREGVKQTL